VDDFEKTDLTARCTFSARVIPAEWVVSCGARALDLLINMVWNRHCSPDKSAEQIMEWGQFRRCGVVDAK
jgi:hypothetical protein